MPILDLLKTQTENDPKNQKLLAKAYQQTVFRSLQFVIEPKTLPWGNRTLQFRDPEGTIISLFTPVTEAARVRFGSL
ncbi:hypothetical protein GCM10007870_24960 [Gluconobacter kondonii]|uniref:Glyoxalase n=1 Tax=Gluconobacter kondonii TaxID=941463 RepID=A0ABQ5WTM1_9PROT|nr:hypothetical protein AA3266_2685 [Gluconobacter kondonii NBRC 3266]GLQ66911.1 hypothetical protein GCM10007870_24960 [Gluconobacter kondonii]